MLTFEPQQGLDPLDSFFQEIDTSEAATEMAATALLDKPKSRNPIPPEASSGRYGGHSRGLSYPYRANVAERIMHRYRNGGRLFARPDHPCGPADQVQVRAKARQEAFLTEWQEAALRGDSFPAQQDLLLPYTDLVTALKRHPVLLTSDLSRGMGQFQPSDALAFPSEPVMPYHGRLEPLAKDIAAWQAENCVVALLAGGEARARRLLRALEQQNVTAVYLENADQPLEAGDVVLLPISVHKGFRNTAAGLCVVSDSDLYGSAYQRKKKKHAAGEHIASFTDLHTGDYVVHDIHGNRHLRRRGAAFYRRRNARLPADPLSWQ